MKRRTVISGLGLLTGSAYLYHLTAVNPKQPFGDGHLSASGKLPQWRDVEALVSDVAADHDLFEIFEAPGSKSAISAPTHLEESTATDKPASSSKAVTAKSEDSDDLGQDDGLIAQVSHKEAFISESSDKVDKNDILTHKSRHFNNEFHDDVVLSAEQIPLMAAVLQRLKRCQALVGFGNFNIISFDKCLNYARNYPKVGAFTKEELAFIDSVFHRNADDYGFFGNRVSQQLTDVIAKKEVIKIPHTGHFLYRGESEKYYQRLLNEVGPELTLTSGIRSNVKQLYLFLSKAAASNYNLSKASRSLAPPGYSFHGIGDFDVGKKGWGWANFSDQFATTEEFKKLLDLGYVQIRYNRDNTLGVRFEPWHIKVV